jgi:GNT-I family
VYVQNAHTVHAPLALQCAVYRGYLYVCVHAYSVLQCAATHSSSSSCNCFGVKLAQTQIAVDFFEYFAAVAPLLDSDSTLLAASAWNDNGMAMHVVDPTQLRRTDFFPGQ